MLVLRVEAEAMVPYPCFEISQITEIETGVLIFFFTCLTIKFIMIYTIHENIKSLEGSCCILGDQSHVSELSSSSFLRKAEFSDMMVTVKEIHQTAAH